MMREATTTIFLRSTIYANTNLTTTTTAVEPPADNTSDKSVAPLVLLGSDTDTTQKVIDRKAGTYGNNLLIKGTVQMPSGTSDTINPDTFDLRLSKAIDGIEAYAVVSRGWVSGENRGNKLAANEFLVEGWVLGSLTITVAVSSIGGAEGYATKSY
jgi:hypothetical protein